MNYGVPQDRRRIYIGCAPFELYAFNSKVAELSMGQMEASIADCAIGHEHRLTVQDLLLDDDHPMVQRDLMYWQEVREKDTRELDDASWQRKHQDEYEKAGLRWGHVQPATALQTAPWFKTLTRPEQDMIVFLMRSAPEVKSVDLSQTICRCRTKDSDDIFPTVTLREKRWHMGRMRLCVAVESMALQGIPWEDLDNTMQCEVPVLQSLAGNAWTATVAQCVFFNMLVHMAWPSAESQQQQQQQPSA